MAFLGRMQKPFLTLMAAVLVWSHSFATAAEVEGPLKPHLEKPHMDLQQVFKGERFGNIVVSMKGTVIATWGTSHVRAKLACVLWVPLLSQRGSPPQERVVGSPLLWRPRLPRGTRGSPTTLR